MTRSHRIEVLRRWAPHLGAGIVLAVLFVWEKSVYGVIHVFRNPFLDETTRVVAQLRGAALPIVVGLILVAWGIWQGRARVRRAGIALLLTAMLVGAAVAVLKPTFARPGPHGPTAPQPGESWISARYGRFPSSHAALLFGTATALAAFIPLTAPAGYTFAVLVCYERLYSGTHLPSDIWAGAWLGITLANFVVGRLARYEAWRSVLGPRWQERWTQSLNERPVWSDSGEAEVVRAVD